MKTNNTTSPMIYIAQEDFSRLRLLAAAVPADASTDGNTSLLAELERATVLPRQTMPGRVVGVNSRVRFKDLRTQEEEEYVITWPEHADAAAQRISVLAPLATGLLGYQEGDEVSWPTPGGIRRLEITHVEQEPEIATREGDSMIERLLAGKAIEK